MVPYKWGQLTSQILREVLPKHEFKTYKVSAELQIFTEYLKLLAFEEIGLSSANRPAQLSSAIEKFSSPYSAFLPFQISC